MTIKYCAYRRTKRTINDISEERLANLVSKVNAVFKHLAALPAEHLSHPVVPNEAESGAAARDIILRLLTLPFSADFPHIKHKIMSWVMIHEFSLENDFMRS